MSRTSADVVIVGGGIAGIAAAYYLGNAGVASVVVERDAVGSHASGFAYGGLGALVGPGVPGPTYAVATEGIRLHRELAAALPEQTGVNIEFRERPSLSLAFSSEEVEEARGALAWQGRQPGHTPRWVGPEEVRSIDARISDAALGGVYLEGTLDVDPYRLVLAMTQAAEAMGATIRHGTATGLRSRGGRVEGVMLENGEISSPNVVLAMGPWAAQASRWLHLPISVRPLKGQIVRLRAPGPPIRCSVGWGGNYATTKPDGLVWAGTTEEEAGFDEKPTDEGRDRIIASLLKMLPALAHAELVRQTACLRPVSADRLPLLGKVPGVEGVYIATGAGREGIALGPAMGRIAADLIIEGRTDIPIDAFDPGRFAR